MSYLNSDKNNISLEWAAMLVGVVVVFTTAYIIFGTEWNVYRVVNVLLGVTFIVFVTYSAVNARNLQNSLRHTSTQLDTLQKENKNLQSALGDAESDSEKLKIDIINLTAENDRANAKIEILEDKLSKEESKEETT